MASKQKTHKKLPKRKTQKKQSFFHKNFTLIFSILTAFFAGILIGGYFYLETDSENKTVKNDKVNLVKSVNYEPSYKEKIDALKIEYTKVDDAKYTNEIVVEEKSEDKPFHYEEPNLEKVDQVVTEVKEKVNEVVETITPVVKEKVETIVKDTKKAVLSNRPKLAIIIDDVTSRSQIKKIKGIGYPVNMAFLPPTEGHPSSAKITKDLNKYMVHLPLQASSSRYEESGTLYINDSFETIENKIKVIKKLYPRAKFINNHTGSKFTADLEAMDKLLRVLKKYNYYFVDSRTTANSVAKKVAKKHNVKMFSRNIFLDNKKEKKYIQNQLKKAIKIAKRDGKAVAIGHPYSITFKTLKDSKELLQGIDLVFIEHL